ncbi:MAG: peroxiredoxin [Ardenticatenales bacterium]|nr:peroxiredoxin [Ardenticatenales bacterium]
MTVIEVGAEAPDFKLKDQSRTEHKLSDYRGKPVVLLFYPLDFSSVCSEEMSCVQDNLTRFSQLDAQVFGVSVDSHHSHRVFAEQRGISYPLLADFHPKGEVSRAYGLYMEEWGYSSRGYVVIGPDGKVAAAKETGPATIPDMDEVAAAVAQAQGSA